MIEVPPKLKALAQGAIVLFLGGVDTGKSTLIRSLHRELGGEVLDADLGQSEIGPPACVSRGDYEHVEESHFVGDISPRGNFIQLLSAVQAALRGAKRPCLIDTDGYIAGEAARSLKGEMVNLVRPDLLVLLQRRGELDYFKLFARKGIEVLEVKVTHQGSKSREERIRAREEAFRRYFQGASLRRWPLKELKFERSPLGHGEPVEPALLEKLLGCPVYGAWRAGDELVVVVAGYAQAQALGAAKELLGVEYIHLINRREIQNLLVGCLLGGRLVGLGIIKGLEGDWIEVLTPAEEATLLQAGRLILSDDGHHRRLVGPEIQPQGPRA
ncbi:MAG: Clp1/GlmU family protein [Candidatus Acetothermia bacterium]|jgi:polynucleotide 5'-hydroxyl-kinase GRC3/NOL9|nr:Clp1/GlmU family protein [Candidatus Acetothermia bacterium]MDH7505758.1 Clp1/GlmU family protein [Candidatus Acetothermia bacterium]